MRPSARTFGLTRQSKSTGLTEAHKQLIKLLAQKAVTDYFAELDAETLDKADRKEAGDFETVKQYPFIVTTTAADTDNSGGAR